MKPAIFLSLTAFAVAVLGVPDAHAWWHRGPEVDQRLSGNILATSVDEDPAGNTTSIANTIAKGQPGGAQINGVLEFKTTFVPDTEGDCPSDSPLKSEIVSFEWGENYHDGSVLAGTATEGQFFRLDLGITRTIADITGIITGGTGRFKGRTGTWRGEASAPVDSHTVTGTLTVDFD